MGGLLGVDLMTSNPNVKFDKMVLFAPAIAMLQRNYLIQIFSPFPSLVIPSAGDKSYLANDGTPMAAYNALFDMHAHFEDHLDPRKINIPAVIFIDEEDELVSYASLQQMVQKHDLDHWRIYPVKKDKTATEVDMHHLIIDAASVGNTMWQEIVEATMNHLLGAQSDGSINLKSSLLHNDDTVTSLVFERGDFSAGDMSDLIINGEPAVAVGNIRFPICGLRWRRCAL
jgi:hypothetical protein